MTSHKKFKASPSISALRLEAIFHPKFDNESSDSDVRQTILARVAAGEGYLEASLKHSGSLLLWSGGQRCYSKNAASNVVTRVGEMLLLRHVARCFGEGWREEYEKCSKYVEDNRLTCSFEVVTSTLGQHGDLPKRDYLILVAVADRGRGGGPFHSTAELVQFAHRFRLPHNDAWMFASRDACEELFRSYDALWETGMATTVIKQLDKIALENEDESAKVASLYPHDVFQGEILEGIVVRYVPYVASDDGNDSRAKGFEEMRELSRASNELLALVPPSRRLDTPSDESILESGNNTIETVDLQEMAAGPDFEQQIDQALQNFHGPNLRRTRRWNDQSSEGEGTEAAKCIDLPTVANEILALSSTGANYDSETLGLARLIQTLNELKINVSYKMLIEDLAGSESRCLCIFHIHNDSSFPKYNAFLRREGRAGMALFRGFSIELVSNEDAGAGVGKTMLDSGARNAGIEPSATEEKLMLKMKFLPYMVRTFICRNGLSILQGSGVAAFEGHAIAQLTKWKVSAASVSKWMPFFRGWARYGSSPSAALPPLTEGTYLHHYHEFDRLYASGEFQCSSIEEPSFHGLIVLVGLSRSSLETLAASLSRQLHCSRIVRDPNQITDKDILLSMQRSGGGLICIAEIEDAYKTLRRLAKEYHEVMHLIMVPYNSEELVGADLKRSKRIKGMTQGWTNLRCNLKLELSMEAAAQRDVESTLLFMRNDPASKAVVDRLVEFTSSKSPDERPGIIVYFPSIPGSGKSSLCQDITADALGIGGDRQLIVLEGDQVKNQSKDKFYSVVEKEVLTKPASVAILDKNVPPASFPSIHSLCIEGKCIAVPIIPAGMQDTVTGNGSFSHVYPFTLQYLATCISRVLKRKPNSHNGKLDSATENACMVVVKFYCFYRNMNVAVLNEKLHGIGHQSREVCVPFFREKTVPDLPASLRSALEEAVILQTREDKNILEAGNDDRDTVEKRLRLSIQDNQEYIDNLAIDLEHSQKAFFAELSSIISSLPEKLESLNLAGEAEAGTIKIASLDINYEAVHSEIDQLRRISPEVEQYFSRREEHKKNDENDKSQDRFITSTHCTFAHASQMTQAAMVSTFRHLVSTPFKTHALSILFNDNIAAIELDIPTEPPIPRPQNAFPHITIWCAGGTEAHESNGLPEKLKCNKAKRVAFEKPIALEGVFSFWYD